MAVVINSLLADSDENDHHCSAGLGGGGILSFLEEMQTFLYGWNIFSKNEGIT
jgi:hypothetical protein